MFTEAPGPLSPRSTSVTGLSGRAKRYYFSYSLSRNWDPVLFSHEFLIVPEFPSPLLGRDILSKVHESVFMNMEPSLSLPLVEQNVNPRVWADGKSVGRAQNAIPVVVFFSRRIFRGAKIRQIKCLPKSKNKNPPHAEHKADRI